MRRLLTTDTCVKQHNTATTTTNANSLALLPHNDDIYLVPHEILEKNAGVLVLLLHSIDRLSVPKGEYEQLFPAYVKISMSDGEPKTDSPKWE